MEQLISKDYFDSLSKNERATLTWQQAEYVMAREYYNQRIQLYAFEDFFVEVWYHPGINRIMKIEAIDVAGLDPYLNRVNLVSFINA